MELGGELFQQKAVKRRSTVRLKQVAAIQVVSCFEYYCAADLFNRYQEDQNPHC